MAKTSKEYLDDSKKLLNVTNEEKRNRERDYAIITIFLNIGKKVLNIMSLLINQGTRLYV